MYDPAPVAEPAPVMLATPLVELIAAEADCVQAEAEGRASAMARKTTRVGDIWTSRR